MVHWTKRHRTLLAVYLVPRRKDGKILLLRRANTGYMDGKLGMVSGHVDGNEPAESAMVREAAEEAGIKVAPPDLRLVHIMHRMAEEGGYEYIDLYFEAAHWQGKPTNLEPNKCSELLWADPNKLPKDIIPVVCQALQHIAAGEAYSSANF